MQTLKEKLDWVRVPNFLGRSLRFNKSIMYFPGNKAGSYLTTLWGGGRVLGSGYFFVCYVVETVTIVASFLNSKTKLSFSSKIIATISSPSIDI